MSASLNKLKSLFSSSNLTPVSPDSEIQPEIGFKLTYFEQTRQLVVKVIGARHLPTVYGSAKPYGYLIKVRVHPGKDKYETEIVKESWPNFNQDISFDLEQNLKNIKEQFLGKFVTLTVYAVLETQDNTTKVKRSKSLRNSFRLFVGEEEKVEVRKTSKARNSSSRFTFNNRRTVGAVTYNLDPKKFTQKHYLTFATPDIWRPVQNITSGIDFERKEIKCNLEVTLTYFNSEDGNNDRMTIALSKLRCGMQTMQQHEKYGEVSPNWLTILSATNERGGKPNISIFSGSLYLKITAFEYGVQTCSWKSDRFEPTISMKIEPTTATLQAIFKNYNLRNVKLVVRMLCKTLLGKKILLGKVEINSESTVFKEAVAAPGFPSTHTLDLE